MNRAGAFIAAVFLAAAAAVADPGAEPSVEVNDPWISEAPPGASVAAAYMEIHNGTGLPLVLVGAAAPRFDRVEMHESTLRDGMASMRRLDRIDIPPGGRVVFAPGGRHFMLFGQPPLPRAGETVPVTLQFDGGAAVELSIPVRGSRQ